MAYKLLDPLARTRSFRLLDPPARVRAFYTVDEGIGKAGWGELALRGMGSVVTMGMSETLPLAYDLVSGGEPKSGTGRMLSWGKDTGRIQRAQDIVDLIGIVDPTGVADAANALGYAAQGKWGDAATSAAGIVPYLGDVAKVAKWGRRGGKLGKAAAKAGEKGAIRAAERQAVRAAEKKAVGVGVEVGAKAAKKSWRTRAKEAYKRGQEYYARAKEAREKIATRRAQETPAGEEGEGAPPKPAERPSQPRGKPATRPAGGEPAKPEKVAEEPRKAPEAAAGGGGTSTGPRGSLQVASSGKCPAPRTKTSVFGAQPGQKRCNPQSTGAVRTH